MNSNKTLKNYLYRENIRKKLYTLIIEKNCTYQLKNYFEKYFVLFHVFLLYYYFF